MAIGDRELKKPNGEVDPTEGSECPTDCPPKEPEFHRPPPSSSESYNLYRDIQGFFWLMPGGWNDIDLKIFIDCCKDYFHDLKSSDEVVKWRHIASSGAKRSRNPTLFTINSCMELSQRLKKHITLNQKNLLNNDSFNRFYRDIENMLEYFSMPPDNQSRSLSTDKLSYKTSMYAFFKTDSVADKLRKLMHSKQDELLSNSEEVWKSLARDVKQMFGVKCDVKHFLSSWKESFLYDLCLTNDEYLKKQLFKASVNNFQALFNVLEPIEVQDLHSLNTRDLCPELKSRRVPHIMPGSRYQEPADDEPQQVVEDKVSSENTLLGEASSTTQAEEPNQNEVVEQEPEVQSVVPQEDDKPEDCPKPFESNSPARRVRKLTRGRKGRQVRQSPQTSTPKRVLPSREAKNKSSTSPACREEEQPSTSRDLPDSTLSFRGFDEPYERVLIPNDRLPVPNNRVPVPSDRVPVPSDTLAKDRVNPDTTTVDDDSDSGFSNSCRFSLNSSSNVIDGQSREDKRSRRNQMESKEPVNGKPAQVNPDSTMQPVVEVERLGSLVMTDRAPMGRRKRGRPAKRDAPAPVPVSKKKATNPPQKRSRQGEVAAPAEPCAERLPSLLPEASTSSSEPSSSTSLVRYSRPDEANHVDLMPRWCEPFLKEMNKVQSWKLLEFKKMQQELLFFENKKMRILEKIVDSLEK